MVSGGFQHGIECQQMQCLVASIFHGGDTQRPHRLLIRFQYVDASKRLRLIASALKCMYCLCLLFGGVPNFLVHTRGFLAIVFRHSTNSENFASFSRVKHLREVGPLSRPVMLSMRLTQPVSAPLQSSLCFLPDLLSAPPSVHLAMYFPFVTGERYGFILFHWNDAMG